MLLQNFGPFVGQHCETTATGSLLNQIGVELSEPMLFGLGEGLSYAFFQLKMMPFPFIGGRPKSGLITENLCRNLGLTLDEKETRSIKKAWTNVAQVLDAGKAVGLQLDSYHLEYFTKKIHFAGHFVAMYGYDDEFAYLVDTAQQGTESRATLENLALARNERGPMAAKNKSFTIALGDAAPDPAAAIKPAIFNTATAFLNPPIKNLGYKGIHKTSGEMIAWFGKTSNVKEDFQTIAMLMERAGTGGSLFRNLYRDFLAESADLLGSAKLAAGHRAYAEIATLWREVSELFHEAGETEDVTFVEQAVEILVDLSAREKLAMEKLLAAVSQ